MQLKEAAVLRQDRVSGGRCYESKDAAKKQRR